MSWHWHLEYSPQISEKMIFKGPLSGSDGSLCSRKISKHSSLQEARPDCLEAKVWVKVIWHLICFLVSQLEIWCEFLVEFLFRQDSRPRTVEARHQRCTRNRHRAFDKVNFMFGKIRGEKNPCYLYGPILYFVKYSRMIFLPRLVKGTMINHEATPLAPSWSPRSTKHRLFVLLSLPRQGWVLQKNLQAVTGWWFRGWGAMIFVESHPLLQLSLIDYSQGNGSRNPKWRYHISI